MLEPATPPERPSITVPADWSSSCLPPGRYVLDGEGDDMLVRLGDMEDMLTTHFGSHWALPGVLYALRDRFNREA